MQKDKSMHCWWIVFEQVTWWLQTPNHREHPNLIRMNRWGLKRPTLHLYFEDWTWTWRNVHNLFQRVLIFFHKIYIQKNQITCDSERLGRLGATISGIEGGASANTVTPMLKRDRNPTPLRSSESSKSHELEFAIAHFKSEFTSSPASFEEPTKLSSPESTVRYWEDSKFREITNWVRSDSC